MWDVKFFFYNKRECGSFLFYLNYVGCKVKELKEIAEKYDMFYLNYVGCKAQDTL